MKIESSESHTLRGRCRRCARVLSRSSLIARECSCGEIKHETCREGEASQNAYASCRSNRLEGRSLPGDRTCKYVYNGRQRIDSVTFIECVDRIHRQFHGRYTGKWKMDGGGHLTAIELLTMRWCDETTFLRRIDWVCVVRVPKAKAPTIRRNSCLNSPTCA